MKYKLVTMLMLLAVAFNFTYLASDKDELTKEQEKLKSDIDEVNEKIMSFEDDINSLEDEIDENKEKISDLKDEQKQTRADLEASQDELSLTMQMMQKLNNTNTLTTYFYNEDMDNNNYFLKLDNINMVMGSVAEEVSSFTTSIAKLSDEIDQVSTLQDQNKKKRDELQKKIDEQTEVETGLKEELTSVEDELDSLEVSSASGNVSSQKQAIMSAAGISSSDYTYVDYIITKESGWNSTAANPVSSAYGLCQSLPGSKMASAGSDWQTNAVTQMQWCNSYAQSRYGSWAGAYSFWISNNWW